MFKKYLATCLLILCFATPALAERTPLEQTKAFVAAMKSVKLQGESSYPTIDKFINYDQLTLETIKPHLKSFSEKQVNAFKPLLETLIRLISYPQSGDFYNDATYTYQTPVIEANKAYVVMDMVFEEEDLEMELGYFWQKTDNGWQLVDLSFDEDSLVKDYQNQFGRIIAKESVTSLIQKLKNKVIEFENENNKKQ